MKEIRIKVENETHDKIARDAVLKDMSQASLASTLVEEHYKNGISVVLDAARMLDVNRSADKQGITVSSYVKNLLDNTLPNDTMRTAIFQIPRKLSGKELKDFLYKKVDAVVGKF